MKPFRMNNVEVLTKINEQKSKAFLKKHVEIEKLLEPYTFVINGTEVVNITNDDDLILYEKLDKELYQILDEIRLIDMN